MTSGAAPGVWNIHSIDGNRGTWAGTCSDIDHAIKEAVEAVRTWSPYGAVVEARLSYKSGLTQLADHETLLAALRRSDLPAVTDLRIDVQPDRRAFLEQQERLGDEHSRRHTAAEAGGDDAGAIERREAEPLPEVSVSLRFSGARGSGLTVLVRGPNREWSEELHSRLMASLARRQVLRRIDISILVPALSIWPLVLLGLGVSHWLDLARRDNKWEWQEIVLMGVGALVAIGAGIAIHLLYPQLEIVEDGGKTRAERLGRSVAGGAVAIALGVVASVIYAHT